MRRHSASKTRVDALVAAAQRLHPGYKNDYQSFRLGSKFFFKPFQQSG